MKEIMFSIIIPIYNAEEYVKETIESILVQTYTNFELVLINDGSTDNSLNIIKNYEQEHDNIKVISRDNKGILKTRIEGIESAKGKYILFLDSDDLIPNDCLNIYMKYLKNNDYDIIRGNYELFSNSSKKQIVEFSRLEVVSKDEYEDKVYYKYLTSPVYNSIWRTIIKKEVYNTSINVNISMGDDQALMLLALEKSNNILLIPDIVYSYRINESSITNVKNINKKCRNYDDVYELYLNIVIPFFKRLNNEKLLKMTYSKYLRDCNMNYFDIYKIGNNKTILEEYQNKLFESEITKEAKNILSKKDIKEQKTYLFLKAILDNNKKKHLRLLKLLKIIKK